MMIYREMTKEDYDAAYGLWENTAGMGLSAADSRDEIIRFLERNRGLSHVCIAPDGGIAGTALCGHDGRRGFLYHVAVGGQYRGKGIGRELVTRCLDRLRSEGIAKCHLMVIGSNAGGQRFWSGIGWELRDSILLYSHST
ncbi:GNAT family N-acetyltransferase [Paenibacillus zanthoxyli]|uniref:GNAT family N-acetyltransferase n=1 Tax=Paenibacillus zanthoxyli TaxID=369399 RepID=UPI002FBE3DF9